MGKERREKRYVSWGSICDVKSCFICGMKRGVERGWKGLCLRISCEWGCCCGVGVNGEDWLGWLE